MKERWASFGISPVVMVTHEESKPTEEETKRKLTRSAQFSLLLLPSPLSALQCIQNWLTRHDGLRPKIITWRSLAVCMEHGTREGGRTLPDSLA